MIVVATTAEHGDETRVALSPETAKKLKALGCEVRIEKGAGQRSYFLDSAFADVGAEVKPSAAEALKDADIVLKVRRPSPEEVGAMKRGALLVGLLDPYADRGGIEALAGAGVDAFAMELIPRRLPRGQSMDVLSSQANLAGYKAVVDAAALFSRAFPMMMTAAGTVPAARVFVVGAAVAGLQAIGTARRLGAVVSATDVRPAAKTEVASLGGKFIAVEDEEFKQAETAGGYAKPMSPEYQRKQAALVAEHIKGQDIVITTALLPVGPAPKLISRAMVESMKPGSIIVDIAADRGGNCELTKAGETVVHNGVSIVGLRNPAGAIAGNASSLYARNLYAFVELLFDKKAGALAINWDDEIVKGTALTRDGADRASQPHGSKGMTMRLPDCKAHSVFGEAATIRSLLPLPGGEGVRSTDRVNPLTRRGAASSTQGRGQFRASRRVSLGLAGLATVAMTWLPSEAWAAEAGGVVDPFVFRLSIFVLAIFVGYYVVWSVTPALHTPLMSVTNAISSVIVVGALLAVGVEHAAGELPASIDAGIASKLFGLLALTMAAVNIFGGFLVTQRMLAMYKKKERK